MPRRFGNEYNNCLVLYSGLGVYNENQIAWSLPSSLENGPFVAQVGVRLTGGTPGAVFKVKTELSAEGHQSRQAHLLLGIANPDADFTVLLDPEMYAEGVEVQITPLYIVTGDNLQPDPVVTTPPAMAMIRIYAPLPPPIPMAMW